MAPKDKENLDVLNGDRGAPGRAAVRVAAVRALLDGLPVEPTGNAAADILAIYAALNAMRVALR